MSVCLRPLGLGDGERVLAWRNSPDIARHMYSDHLISVEEHQRWLAHAVVSPERRLWIIERQGEPVGLAALQCVMATARRWDWAFYLADPAVRGQGVGACVEYLILGYAFDILEINKLWCEVLLRNDAVWRLHLSFGFKREADLRDHVWKDGAFQDVVGLGLLAEEWKTQKPEWERRLASRGLLHGAVVVSSAEA